MLLSLLTQDAVSSSSNFKPDALMLSRQARLDSMKSVCSSDTTIAATAIVDGRFERKKKSQAVSWVRNRMFSIKSLTDSAFPDKPFNNIKANAPGVGGNMNVMFTFRLLLVKF
ncbi:hypothetical protein ACHAXN_004982 [Cyclotella atomus]